MENMENRLFRPHTAAKPLVEFALRERFGYTGRVRWSQKAGCLCGCFSPGFVLDDNLGTASQPIDLWAAASENKSTRPG